MFNIDNLELTEDNFRDVPVGKYCAKVVSAEEVEATSKSGVDYKRIDLVFKVIGGEYDGCSVFKRAIYDHANQQAADIGIQFLCSVFGAQGNKPGTKGLGTSDLVSDVPVEIVVKLSKGGNGYEPRPELRFVNVCKNCPDQSRCTDSQGPISSDDIF